MPSRSRERRRHEHLAVVSAGQREGGAVWLLVTGVEERDTDDGNDSVVLRLLVWPVRELTLCVL